MRGVTVHIIVISQLVLLSRAQDEVKEIRICDSTTNQNAPTIYTNYVKSLYSQGFSTATITMPTNCDEFDKLNNYLFAWGNNLAQNMFGKNIINLDINGRRAECARISQNIENSIKGIGLSVNWPITYLIQTLLNTNDISGDFYKRYTEQTLTLKYNTYDATQLHSFVTKSDRSTVWTSVTFERPPKYDTGPLCNYDWTRSIDYTILCIHPFYRLADAMFDRPYTFSSTGLEEANGYITFNKALYTGIGRKIVQVRGADGKLKWGVLMTGCSPPTFELRVVWGNNIVKKCNRPEITVINIKETENFACVMDFTTNLLRNQVPSMGVAEMRKSSEAILIGKVFAKKKDTSTQVILISAPHAKTISNCIFSEQTIPMKWDAWSESTPGKCTTCSTASGSFISKTPRACKMELAAERSRDCCFDCAKGYNLLTYHDAEKKIEEEHCIRACQKGYAYDDERDVVPRCALCVPGKYNRNSGIGGCQNCFDLGFKNAVVISTKSGCVSCGNRAAASPDGTTCVPCGQREYVPEDQAYCTKCPQGSRLISAESGLCTPCSPGYEFTIDGTCVLCRINTFKSNNGRGDCTACPYATRALPNRTMCVPCNNLDKRIAPLAIYKMNTTCEAVCNLSVSYANNNNPYTTEGCKTCVERPPPIGTYSDPDDCSNFIPCTNAPDHTLIEYTGTGPVCPWKCRNGYKKSEDSSQCIVCNSQGFNVSLHVYTTQDCLFTCIPKLYYRGAGMACDQPCTNLLSEGSLLVYLRLSDYYSFYLNGSKILVRRTWPNYIMGKCGSDETDTTSSIPLLKYVGIYGFLSEGGTCGNFILNTGEECDDGNLNNNDGCDSYCRIERDDFWDCNVIGEPCKRLCGWSEVASDSWGVGLTGYAFDPRPAISKGLPWCTGVGYYQDFLHVLLESRSVWMQQNLIACDCESNPMQVLPYKECNYTNGGCRECERGNYRDDLYARCTPCGSTCALGFRSYDATKDGISNDHNARVKSRYGFEILDQCSPHIATSKNMSFADPVKDPYLFGREQIMIGCVPCDPGYNDIEHIVFVPGDDVCNWICKRDPANQSDVDYYCGTSAGSVCNEICYSCDEHLKIVQNNIQYEASQGKYIKSCTDLTGHDIGDCDTPPLNARYSGNSVLVVGDSAGCPWGCNNGYHRFKDQCMFCSLTPPVCGKGEMIVSCGDRQGFHCASCVYTKDLNELSPMEIWHSLPDYSDCVPGCEAGVSYKNTSNPSEKCQACTQHVCELNELFVPCAANEDSTCIPCVSITEGELSENHREFYIRGTCKTRCAAGYASDSFYCVPCSTVACKPGYRKEYTCMAPYEREALPSCVECRVEDSLYTPGRKWDVIAGECATSCIDGWMFQEGDKNKTCIPCQDTQCNEGYGANCARGKINCYPCPLSMESLVLKHMKYTGPGNCSSLACESSAYTLVRSDDDGEKYCEQNNGAQGNNNNEGNLALKNGGDEWGVDLMALTMNVTDEDNNITNAKTLYPRRNFLHSAQT